MKSCIKRPFSEINDYIKQVIPTIREDANGNVQFVVSNVGAEEPQWPAHMAGVYIANVIKDVQTSYNVEKVCSTISVRLLSLLD